MPSEETKTQETEPETVGGLLQHVIGLARASLEKLDQVLARLDKTTTPAAPATPAAEPAAPAPDHERQRDPAARGAGATQTPAQQLEQAIGQLREALEDADPTERARLQQRIGRLEETLAQLPSTKGPA